MNQLFWHFTTNSPFEILAALAIPFAIFFFQYEVDYLLILVRHIALIVRHGTPAAPVAKGERPAALVVMPTLLRSSEELVGLKEAILSAANNGYRGPLFVVAAIDDGHANPEVYAELEAWAGATPTPDGVRLFVTCTTERRGKACAIDVAMQLMMAKVASGEIPELPPIFFNMDADSELGPDALVRMADRLRTRSWLTGAPPRLVTSNVSIAKEHFWFGWRGLFTVRGQIALQVAREYLTAISLGKFNTKLVPVLWASGALYCTWTKLHVISPRWGAFMQTLRITDWAAWWLGKAPPSFATSDVEDLPEAQTGPGDDTWMTWLACCARWKDGELIVELPRTPAHAAWYAFSDYFVRPVRHEPDARIMTRTPTTVKALFKQRIRWNTSRIQDVQRWRPAMMFHWTVGLPAFLSTAQLVIVNLSVAFSLLVWPFVTDHGGFLAFMTALGLNVFLRTTATLLGLIVDRPVRGNALKLLALPLSMPYHMFFNVFPTIIGSVQDIFLFGVNTKFSPEATHIRSGTTRIAIAFRVRRALALSVRALLVNDVPLGFFWFGWRETAWTPSGFEGWTSGKKRRAILPPSALAFWRPAASPVAANVVSKATVTEAAPAAPIDAAPPTPPAQVLAGAPVARPQPRLVSIRPVAQARRPQVQPSHEDSGPSSGRHAA